MSDVHAERHDLREVSTDATIDASFDHSYVESQLLATKLLDHGALGMIYPSVRHSGGTCTCIACFRPAIVGDVRRGETLIFVGMAR